MNNLFKKQSAKFVQNPSSFTTVMAKHILVYFLCPTVYYYYMVIKPFHFYYSAQLLNTDLDGGCDKHNTLSDDHQKFMTHTGELSSQLNSA